MLANDVGTLLRSVIIFVSFFGNYVQVQSSVLNCVNYFHDGWLFEFFVYSIYHPSVICIAAQDIFPMLCCCVFAACTVSFEIQKVLVFMRSYISIGLNDLLF